MATAADASELSAYVTSPSGDQSEAIVHQLDQGARSLSINDVISGVTDDMC